jgi:hypothetical protein
MVSNARKVLENAYDLEERDRAIVSAELSEPVEDADQVRTAWLAAGVDRLERLERGEGETQSLEEAEAEVRAALERR